MITNPPILESVFEYVAPNAERIETIAEWENDDRFASWVWSPLSYRELAELTSDIARSTNPYAASIWCSA